MHEIFEAVDGRAKRRLEFATRRQRTEHFTKWLVFVCLPVSLLNCASWVFLDVVLFCRYAFALYAWRVCCAGFFLFLIFVCRHGFFVVVRCSLVQSKGQADLKKVSRFDARDARCLCFAVSLVSERLAARAPTVFVSRS